MPGIDQHTKLLLHADGTDAGTTFTDSSTYQSAKTVTANGNAQLDTAQQKFGTASGLFDGTGDYLTTPDHADFSFGSGDFTIDFWVRFSSLAANRQTIYWHQTDASNYIAIVWNNSDTRWQLEIVEATVAIVQVNATDTISIDTWYHVAAVKKALNTTYEVFRDGVSKGSSVDASVPADYSSSVYVGMDEAASWPLFGWLDELRVSKGIARWTTTFTPPIAAYDTVDLKSKMFNVFE